MGRFASHLCHLTCQYESRRARRQSRQLGSCLHPFALCDSISLGSSVASCQSPVHHRLMQKGQAAERTLSAHCLVLRGSLLPCQGVGPRRSRAHHLMVDPAVQDWGSLGSRHLHQSAHCHSCPSCPSVFQSNVQPSLLSPPWRLLFPSRCLEALATALGATFPRPPSSFT